MLKKAGIGAVMTLTPNESSGRRPMWCEVLESGSILSFEGPIRLKPGHRPIKEQETARLAHFFIAQEGSIDRSFLVIRDTGECIPFARLSPKQTFQVVAVPSHRH